jgi:diguanylate cyclase (GGDEF)-like protein
MILVTIALTAAVAVLVVLATAYLVTRHSARVTDDRISAVVADLNERMETIVQELQRTVLEAEEESRRSRAFGELAGSIDLDEVITRALESAGAIPGVDAALVSLDPGVEERRLVATLGLSAEEAEREGVIAGPPDGRPARAVSMTYSYRAEELSGNGELVRAGLAVPLLLEGERMGDLAVFSRSAGRNWSDDELDEVEDLARRAAPAIENARRFREARRLADLDALTGLHNRRYFHETLAREIARAHRYRRDLALIVFDLDDFKAINDRIGHLAGDGVLAGAAERIRDVVRSADVACRVGGDEFAIILPESGLEDADQLYRRLQQATASRPIGQAGSLTLSAGIADLRPEDDAMTFFQRADDALYRAKEGGKGRVVAADAVG